jgi:hypothetical protein
VSVLIVRDDSILGAEDEAQAVVELEVPIAQAVVELGEEFVVVVLTGHPYPDL